MSNDDVSSKMNDLFMNPLFKIGFFEFFAKMQKEGIEVARNYWMAYAEKNSIFPNVLDTYERMADFYIICGFVPKKKYDEALDENENLKDENKFLRDVMRELRHNIFTEGGEAAENIWHKSIDKQLEVNKEITKKFFDLFRMLKVSNE